MSATAFAQPAVIAGPQVLRAGPGIQLANGKIIDQTATLDITAYGGACDEREILSRPTVTSGSKIVTVPSANFTQADLRPVPKLLSVATDSGVFNSLITSVDSSTQVHVADNAPASLTPSTLATTSIGTDNTAAFAAASGVVHSAIGLGGGTLVNTAWIYTGGPATGPLCLAKGPVDLTVLKSSNRAYLNAIVLRGLHIHIVGDQTVGVDALGSDYIKFEDASLIADANAKPKILLQIGRYDATIEVQRIDLDNPQLYGDAGWTTVYDYGSEELYVHGGLIGNADASPSAYAFVVDAYNQLHAQTSSFVTSVLPADTLESTNGTNFMGGSIVNTGDTTAMTGGPAMYFAGVRALTVQNSYAYSGYSDHLIDLVDRGGTANRAINLEIHGEGANLLYDVNLGGNQAAMVLKDFQYKEHSSFAQNALLHVDPMSSVTSVALQGNSLVRVTNFHSGGAVQMLYEAGVYSLQGDFFLPTLSNYATRPASLKGCVHFQDDTVNDPCDYDPMASDFIVNPDFELDRLGNGVAQTIGSAGGQVADNTTVTDGFQARFTATSGHLSAQVVSAGNLMPGYPHALEMAEVATPVVDAATNVARWEWRIEAKAETAMLQWGTASARPLTIAIKGYTDQVGQGPVCFSLRNDTNTGTTSRSYVFCFPFTSTFANYQVTIPGETTGNWQNGVGHTWGILAMDGGTGSNRLTVAGVWNSSGTLFSGAPGEMKPVTISGAHVRITGIHFYPGYLDQPWERQGWERLMDAANRRLQMSFGLGTAPAQSAGVANARCMRVQIATSEPSTFVDLKPFMVATPTVTTYNPSAANANLRDVQGAADVTIAVDPATAIGPRGFEIAAAATVATMGHDECVHWKAQVDTFD